VGAIVALPLTLAMLRFMQNALSADNVKRVFIDEIR
jgi:hypothetical protein